MILEMGMVKMGVSDVVHKMLPACNNNSEKDIYDHLPEHTFTLKEWSEWVEAHPEFIEIL
jgi:hypothetical protein